MRTAVKRKPVTIALAASVVIGLCAGCNEGNSNMKLSPIYTSALTGALIGGIIGYQSDETGEGAALGAAVFGVGQLLSEMDQQHKAREHKKKRPEQVTIQIHNDNGSITPVKLKKEGSTYIGPKGERYEKLPTEKQLKPIYGLK
jgi:hypothetical protein